MSPTCPCPLCGAFRKSKQPSTWASGSLCCRSWTCRSYGSAVAASMTELTSTPGSMNIRASEGGPERRLYGPT